MELWNYRKDGSAFRNAVLVSPVTDESGETVLSIGTQIEVPIRSAPGLASKPARRRVLGLTPKQRQVLKLITIGHRDAQIGEQLGIGNSAVKRLRNRMLTRLGVSTIADAIRIGVQAGLT